MINMLFPVRDGDLFAYIDGRGRVVGDARYDYASEFSDGLAQVASGRHRYFIDSALQRRFECLDELYYTTMINGRCVVWNTSQAPNLHGAVDSGGYLQVGVRFNAILPFYDGMAPCLTISTLGETWGFVSESGVCLKHMGLWNRALPFAQSNGLAAVEKDGKWGLVDRTGRLQFPLGFEASRSSTDGTFLAKDQGFWYFFKTTGEPIVEVGFEYARPFREGLAAVKRHGKWGFIDLKGSVVIDFQFDDARSFRGGRAIVGTGGVPIAPDYHEGALYGIIDSAGCWIVPCKFQSIDDYAYGVARFEHHKWDRSAFMGYIDSSGNIVWSSRAGSL